jgi:NAD(P)-dependent dehydrogenase (short-subunit alcohol dehydrogenase family)
MKYQDRVAVVSGAGSGIGRALTLALTRNGAHVAASDINQKGLAETQAACPPGRVTTYELDVADRDAMLAHAEDVRRDLGPASMLFNNAGVDLFAGVADMSWKDFDWLIGINVGGVVNGTKAFLPQLIESGTPRRPARLINLSSAFGLIAVPYQGAYSTSKFAVRGFTEALRQEMIIERRPVTVHCVHPGVVRTNFGRTCVPRTPRIPTRRPNCSREPRSRLPRRPRRSSCGERTETAPEFSSARTGA